MSSDRPRSSAYADYDKERYVSNLCRNGPYPITRHHCTDLLCLVAFIVLMLITIILFIINLASHQLEEPAKFSKLSFFQQVAYSMWSLSSFVSLVCAGVIAIGIILLLLVLAAPKVMGIATIIISLGLFSLMVYDEITFKWGSVWAYHQAK